MAFVTTPNVFADLNPNVHKMAKTYKGTLSLDWYNKQQSILLREKEDISLSTDVPAPKINWVNKDEALFYEIDSEGGIGLTPYWVERNDIRVKEARPLILQKVFKAVAENKPGTLQGMDNTWKVVESKEDDSAVENILIKGDNLLALNTLKKMFSNKPEEEKVKCIYIDPPYNTGSAFGDKYDDNLEHSEWLTFIRDRVDILKYLLRIDGMLFVSIDGNEQAYLKILLDEIMGKENYLDTIVVRSTPNARDYGHVAKMHEYIHVYAKDASMTVSYFLNDDEKEFKYQDDKSGFNIHPLYNSNTNFHHKNRPNLYYPFYLNPEKSEGSDFFEISLQATDGWVEIFPPKSVKDNVQFVWRWGKELSNSELNKEIVGYMVGKGEYRIVQKMRHDKKMVRSLWLGKEYSNRNGTEQLQKLFSNKVFPYPKPEALIKTVMEVSTLPGDLVLDCFGGSGTTFAVANKMQRKWIGVEIGNQADDIIVPRLKKALTGEDKFGVSEELGWTGGGSFKYYHLGQSIITINEDGSGDFNWSLGKKFIEESFLSSYDYILDKTVNLSEGQLFLDQENTPSIGIQSFGTKKRVAVISLNEPGGLKETLSYEEIFHIYSTIKKQINPEYINIFTNKGLELAYDSKPDDLDVIKVPHAIFSELEK